MGSDNFNHNYLTLRKDARSTFGYGLMRRTEQARKLVGAELASRCDEPVRLVDFGCSDGAMLFELVKGFGPRIRHAVGFDIFPHGEVQSVLPNVRFFKHDLYRQFPYPIGDAGADVLLASAFFKHLPEPDRFLAECVRILPPGGLLILLDPRPGIVRLGGKLGYFNLGFVPNLWDPTSMRRYSSVARGELRIAGAERYWSAPNARARSLGFERLAPPRWFGLHQSLTLRRRDAATQ